MTDYKIEMGKRMKLKRKELNLTQEKMAEMLDISIKHYSGVERGVAGLSIENLVQVSNILGLNLDYLIKGDTTKKELIPEQFKALYLNCPPEKRECIIDLLNIAHALLK